MNSFTTSSIEFFEKLLTQYKEENKELMESAKELADRIQQAPWPAPYQPAKFACFSEDINPTAMWGYYADSGCGLALACDFRSNWLHNV